MTAIEKKENGITTSDTLASQRASLTWLDLTAGDRDTMRKLIDLLSEKGTIDEMGLGTIRDAFSDALFPGTSSLQTRMRYFFFVPWLYQGLEKAAASGARVAEQIRQAETDLIASLSESSDRQGVIGAVARSGLTRLPSEIYWPGLLKWGIFQERKSRSWYHTHLERLARGHDAVGHTADDPGVVVETSRTWDVRLPKPPDGFPKTAELALTAEEAGFLLERIEECCPGSLLAWLARNGSSNLAAAFWDEPAAWNAGGELRQTVELARRFSRYAEGPVLLYNLLLAEQRNALRGTDEDPVEEHRAALDQWAEFEAADTPFDPQAIWQFMFRYGKHPAQPQRKFVEVWAQRVAAVGAARIADDQEARDRVKQREIETKTTKRARLVDRGRLLDWSGRVGVGTMDFRWSTVRQLLIDLHRGLER